MGQRGLQRIKQMDIDIKNIRFSFQNKEELEIFVLSEDSFGNEYYDLIASAYVPDDNENGIIRHELIEALLKLQDYMDD